MSFVGRAAGGNVRQVKGAGVHLPHEQLCGRPAGAIPTQRQYRYDQAGNLGGIRYNNPMAPNAAHRVRLKLP